MGEGLRTVYDCSVIELDRYPSERLGNLSVVHSEETLPFDVKRVFFIYDVPGGESRGGHAHKAVKEFIVAVSGSFSITLDDGRDRRTVMLNRPYVGLLVEPGVWLTLHDFSSGAIALVFTSDYFSHSDHIKDYEEFRVMRSRQKLN
ncbi:MAG: FdtA/QdtA family cupin domain-containing protein [Muribaculaceae bacterium]|nr:FdtA/QdtA family cupin domain-containing protein [Muribaculaceae bacterium]